MRPVRASTRVEGSKAVLVSVELLQDASFDLSAYLGKALGTRVARIKNTHFTTGDNSSKPQGFTVGGSSGGSSDFSRGSRGYSTPSVLIVSSRTGRARPCT